MADKGLEDIEAGESSERSPLRSRIVLRMRRDKRERLGAAPQSKQLLY